MCCKSWDSVDDILDHFGIEVMGDLRQAALRKLSLAKVEKSRDARVNLIKQIKQVNTDVIKSFMASPIKLYVIVDALI